MKTSVTFLLDRSGSMASIKRPTIDGFNAYLRTIKEGADDIYFTFLQFDSYGLDKVCVNVPVADARELTDETFEPRGSTPLIDACYKTIKAVEKSLNGSPAKVVICFQTDGEENSSLEYTTADLNALIKEKIAAGWQFNFMGASIDAYRQAKQMGISMGSTISYDSMDMVATQDAFLASARNTNSYATGASASTEYTAAQKSSSGDKYAHRYVSQPVQPLPAAAGAAVSKPVAEKPKPIVAVEDITL